MKKYLVLYLHGNRIQNVFVVSEAASSKQAKQAVAIYHPADPPVKVAAFDLDAMKGLWRYS